MFVRARRPIDTGPSGCWSRVPVKDFGATIVLLDTFAFTRAWSKGCNRGTRRVGGRGALRAG